MSINEDLQVVETRSNLEDVILGSPVFTSFYTIDNGYKEEADRLIRSLEEFNLPYYCEGIMSGGKEWDAIVKRKPELVLKVLDMLPGRDVVWIDSDAAILQLPTDLFNLEVDFACCYKNKTKLHSAVLFFSNSNIARNICKDWIKENNKTQKYRTGDQKHLENVIYRTSSYKAHLLPDSYIKTCSTSYDSNAASAVIDQYYASNRLKNIHLNIFKRTIQNFRLKPEWLRQSAQKWFMILARYKLGVPRFLQ